MSSLHAFLQQYKPYTGIGSRTIPSFKEMNAIWNISYYLNGYGYTLRSGGANGSDLCFENDVRKKEIFLPYKGFNDSESPFFKPSEEAMKMAKEYHPNWNALNSVSKKMMARNVHQVLGPNLDYPSLFLVCYTSDGCEKHKDRTRKTGGTGQAISIADDYDIPIFNIANGNERLEELTNLVYEIEGEYND